MESKTVMVLALLAAAVSGISAACPVLPGNTTEAGIIQTAINASTLNTTCQSGTDTCGSCLCNLTTIFIKAFQAGNLTVSNASNVNVSSAIAPTISACVTNWTTQLTTTGANATILSNVGSCTPSPQPGCLAATIMSLVPVTAASGPVSSPAVPASPASPANTTKTGGSDVASATVMGLLSAISLAAMLL